MAYGAAAGSAAEPGTRQAGAAGAAGRDAMRIRVLLAEDHPVLRESLVRALDRDPGIEIVGAAPDGHAALRLAGERRPDVVVLDLGLPGIGGAAVLHRLRSQLPDIRVLILTANESPESLLDAVAAGAAGYLSKATTGEELRQAVIAIHGGGSVITPSLAGHLMREVAGTARGEGSPVRPVMSERELAVLRLVARGHTDREIAAELYLSPRTIQNHLTRIREKTGARRRSELARWAVERAVV
jgi:DNA-binding NarL/FixJ family response regulator